MREFRFVGENIARSAAGEIAVPTGFDAGRRVGKKLASVAHLIKSTVAMVSPRPVLDEDGETPTGEWVISVDSNDAEKRAALAPLSMSERDIPDAPNGVSLPMRKVGDVEIDRS